jgi:GTP-binding protein HflX
VDAPQNGGARRARQRALTIGVGSDGADLAELRELLRTAGVAVVGEMVQRRERPDPDRYFGRGKLVELKQAAKEADANLIAVDDELLPRQERNLEEELGIPVIDRTAIILDIFADHARSAEGKLQVELAQLEYNLARMRGLWTHLERLGAGRMDGGIGTRGPGESQIETDRRLARNRISALRARLRETKATRETMRRERERAALPSVALAGYTNAGKSTLLNSMTGAEVGVRERLFHTLDPTTRSFEISGRQYLLTDTVGFIRKLPHQLVEAFSATLEEALGADLVLHVVTSAAARCPSASPMPCRSPAPPARASRPCARRSRAASWRRCGRWSCSCPTATAERSRSCTSWPASWSVRTRPRECASAPVCRPRRRPASSASRRTATDRPLRERAPQALLPAHGSGERALAVETEGLRSAVEVVGGRLASLRRLGARGCIRVTDRLLRLCLRAYPREAPDLAGAAKAAICTVPDPQEPASCALAARENIGATPSGRVAPWSLTAPRATS